jgi:hypothetical protein
MPRKPTIITEKSILRSGSMSTVERPGLWNFIKAKLIPFAGSSEFIMSRNGSVKYRERRKTVRLSYLLYLSYFLLLFYIIEIKGYKVRNVVDFFTNLILFYAIAFLLETVHWLFAKFDRVKV